MQQVTADMGQQAYRLQPTCIPPYISDPRISQSKSFHHRSLFCVIDYISKYTYCTIIVIIIVIIPSTEQSPNLDSTHRVLVPGGAKSRSRPSVRRQYRTVYEPRGALHTRARGCVIYKMSDQTIQHRRARDSVTLVYNMRTY